jgi:ribosomal protein S18 acetylase RimI-like enzyme
LEAAFRLVFQTWPADERQARVTNALAMVREGELDPAGVVVARGPAGLGGVIVAALLAGAGGLIWPPRTTGSPDASQTENQLVRYATQWLRSRGAKLGQALLAPADAELGAPLTRNGFDHVTHLWYLRHGLRPPGGETRKGLAFQTYRESQPAEFHDTLQRTYQGSADCPELGSVRTTDEVIAGHVAQGRHDPARWWLALDGGRPVGVLLLTERADAPAWDLSYLGVIPEARRRGIGETLALKAVRDARAGGACELTLAVDARNRPARALYRRLGFEEVERREVYLAVWCRNA